MRIEPYKHDCDSCQWVGWYSGGKRLANIYICKRAVDNNITVIIRYSDEPSDYWSMSTFEGNKPCAVEVADNFFETRS